ncbi:hypothetical protein ACNS7O_03280 [Haloferacaceae archaeon DSL9]
MNEQNHSRTTVIRTIGGVDALVNTEPGEIFLDLPATSPRYIRVREGDFIQQGDVQTRTTAEMSGPRLTKWRIESISEDTVTGTTLDTGETKEWERASLEVHLGTGEFSAELTTFDRVSVTETEEWDTRYSIEGAEEKRPYVIVVVYGNNGEKFTQLYAATESGNWDSLQVVQTDRNAEKFDDELLDHFTDVVREAIEIEQRYQ